MAVLCYNTAIFRLYKLTRKKSLLSAFHPTVETVGFLGLHFVSFELLLVTFTMRFNEFPNRDNVDLVHAFFLSFYYNYTLPIN